jgi:hypothetical protein
MKQEEFESLKAGDTVVYNGANSHYYGCVKGDILTRVDIWLDDNSTRRFNYDGDWDFFQADEVDFIKE